MEAVMRRGGTEKAAPFYPSSHEVVGQRRIILVFFSLSLSRLHPTTSQMEWGALCVFFLVQCMYSTFLFFSRAPFVHIANTVICKTFVQQTGDFSDNNAHYPLLLMDNQIRDMKIRKHARVAIFEKLDIKKIQNNINQNNIIISYNFFFFFC